MDRLESDRYLMAQLAAGDPSGLELLYDHYSRPVFALLVRIVANRHVAEDLLQEVFVRAWQHADRFDPARGSLLAWLLSIAHHLALNELRRARRQQQYVADTSNSLNDLDVDFFQDSDPGPEEVAWLRARRLQLVRALDRLSRPERVVIELYASGYSQSEIARELGEPLGTVKTRMRRGLFKLRAIAEEMHLECD